MIDFCEVHVISRLSVALRNLLGSHVDLSWCPHMLICLIVRSLISPLGQDLYFVIIVTIRPTCGLDGYIFEL